MKAYETTLGEELHLMFERFDALPDRQKRELEGHSPELFGFLHHLGEFHKSPEDRGILVETLTALRSLKHGDSLTRLTLALRIPWQ